MLLPGRSQIGILLKQPMFRSLFPPDPLESLAAESRDGGRESAEARVGQLRAVTRQFEIARPRRRRGAPLVLSLVAHVVVIGGLWVGANWYGANLSMETLISGFTGRAPASAPLATEVGTSMRQASASTATPFPIIGGPTSLGLADGGIAGLDPLADPAPADSVVWQATGLIPLPPAASLSPVEAFPAFYASRLRASVPR